MEQFCQDKTYNIAIVGAGPAGVYCALNLALKFKEANFDKYKISIFDKSQALRTILPTGGGRCNITNAIFDIKEFASNYPRGEKFLYSLFSSHFNYDSIEFFNKIGIKTYIQSDGRIFPKSNSAKDVKDKMLSALKKYKNIKLINKEIFNKNELENFDRIVLCAGSRNTTKLIQSFKQPMEEFKRALCALKVENFNFPKGISIKALDGDFVTTSDGISGPLAFKISSLNVDLPFPYKIEINLFNAEELEKLIQLNTKKTIGILISKLIPKSFAQVHVSEFNKKASEISKERLKQLSKLELNILGNSSLGEIVHKGGVCLDSVDKNCKSKICDNLWFCGEILNIDGFCGGFNLQNCWSSAYVVANDVVRSIINK
ncbi:MAG: aminoacetone oxidase family FAD-binding enzyme [Candidatus Gastranaerophilales bacterium]|nr:aminoacetone oxidase family FAD-binding enzyme [Candidatus Gastranaerophilales bacterium]